MANTPINPYGQQQGDQVTLGTGTRLCYVLAANDTAADKKHYADAVCDGINDEVEIQQYIDLAIANKRKLVLLKGTYYVDAATKKTQENNDTYILADLTNADNADGGLALTIEGEDPYNIPVIRLSDAAYEALDNSKQMSLFSVSCPSTFGGGVDIKNIYFRTPWNQKKVVLVDFLKFGGYARLHSILCASYISGYDGHTVGDGNLPDVAVEGSIGIRFIAKGPQGVYGSEITDCFVNGAYEGVSINSEWTICNHVCPIYCVYGWTFGHYYGGGGTKSTTHPILLLNCGDERNVNLPYFYSPYPSNQGGRQDIEMIAFSVERNATNTPGKVLGNMAMEQVAGSARGVINYTCGQGQGNYVDRGFWAHGHGKNVHTTDMAHARAGDTATRASYRPNYLQKYYDTDLNKEVTCINTENKTWIDNAGNTVSNS